jgi:hypothetical protein
MPMPSRTLGCGCRLDNIIVMSPEVARTSPSLGLLVDDEDEDGMGAPFGRVVCVEGEQGALTLPGRM